MIDTETLANRGFTVTPGLIGPAECRALAALWPDKARFRSHVIMQRHGYGQGEYQYFTYPLPKPVEALRQALYPELANIANRWNEQLGLKKRFPPTLEGWLRQCHDGGQKHKHENDVRFHKISLRLIGLRADVWRGRRSFKPTHGRLAIPCILTRCNTLPHRKHYPNPIPRVNH